jgi:restriction endonuclease S subunit
MSEEKKKYSSNDIVESDKLFEFPKFQCDRSKIMKILVEASMKAQTSNVQVVEVKGKFLDEEVRSMKYVMKTKGYDMWKCESGYIFVPIKEKKSPFGFNNQNTIPWGGFQQKTGWNSGFNFDNPFGFNNK